MEDVKEKVRRHYAERAVSVTEKKSDSCCASTSCCDPITSDLYGSEQTAGLPDDAILASLGCGNPTLLAELHPGETVLDLGSGGGIDVLLSAKRVGSTGKAYGVDMTDEMLELARRNQRAAQIENAEFLRGDIEHLPLPDETVDVVISNCVINLSTDKARVLREAFRVLKHGGRFAVSDVVRRKEIPAAVAQSLELWAGCIAGALHEDRYRELLEAAGFEEIELHPTRLYRLSDAGRFLEEAGIDPHSMHEADEAFMSAFVKARKR